MPDWAAVRETQFPGIAKHVSYLNTAVSGLMSRAAVAAVAEENEKWAADAAAAVYNVSKLDEAREGLARMMGCDVGEVAITGNTTDGLNIACALLDTDAVALEDEFSSGPIAWMQAKHNVHFVTAAEVDALGGDILGALDAKLAATPTAKALLLSSVSYMDGHAVDLERAGAICAARGVDLVVDGSQSLGVEPLDLSKLNVAFLCGASYKWLCAGPGLGILFASASVLARLEPGAAPAAGWFGQAIDGRNYELNPHDDAQRFHYGTPNLTILAALCASLKLIDEEFGGVAGIAARNLELSSYMRGELLANGFSLMGAFGRSVAVTDDVDAAELQSSHITGVAIPFAEPKAVATALESEGIVVTAKDRHGVTGLRVACHIYNNTQDIDAFVGALAEIRDRMTAEAGAEAGAGTVEVETVGGAGQKL